MARIKPTNVEIIKKLTSFNKPYFTVADLEKVLTLPHKSLLVTLTRLVKAGVLIRIRRNLYTVFTSSCDVEKISNELYYPSYVSFETALSHYGILSQIPYTTTLVTLRPSRKIEISGNEVEYSNLKKDLFFGYKNENGRYMAEPEKALLDELYMMSRGHKNINIEELDLRDIKIDKFVEYAKRFQEYILDLVNKVKKYIGTTPITNEHRERTDWTDGGPEGN